MYGAILGDIIGSPYEFDRNNYKAKDFPLFSERSQFTDDTVMTLAAAATRWLASPAASPRAFTACALKEECRARLSPELFSILLQFERQVMCRA